MTEEKKISPNVLKEIADTFKQLQLTLEPVRDKALDEKARAGGHIESAQQFAIASINAIIRETEKRARMEGYSQCAEQFLQIIVTRMDDLYKQADEASKLELIKLKNDFAQVPIPQEEFEDAGDSND